MVVLRSKVKNIFLPSPMTGKLWCLPLGKPNDLQYRREPKRS